MKASTFLILILGIVLYSCQSEDPVQEQEAELLLNQEILIDGLERNYHVQTPGNTLNKPVVFVLHGHGGSADQSIGQALGKAVQRVWLDLAIEEDFLVIVPNGELGPEDTRGWNDCRNDAPGNPETDDVLFLSELLDKIELEFSPDMDRVYIAGVSNGASMAIRLTQEIPERIAAFASIVTTMPVNSECPDSSVPISALFMNGTEDLIAPYGGGSIVNNRGQVQSTDESVDYWLNRNNTDRTPSITTFEDIDDSDGGTVEKYVYENGLDNTEVVLYKVIGGGHTEPSLIERYSQVYLNIVGKQNGDIEMANEVWSFFKNKSK